jgi:hypothetical protein
MSGVRPIEDDAAAPCGHKTHERLEKRRLAHSIGPEDTDELPRRDVQLHAVENGDAAVSGMEIRDLWVEHPKVTLAFPYVDPDVRSVLEDLQAIRNPPSALRTATLYRDRGLL